MMMPSEIKPEEFIAKAREAGEILNRLYDDLKAPTNTPGGCWDWFGYTGADYALKSGKQIRAITKMMAALGIPL